MGEIATIRALVDELIVTRWTDPRLWALTLALAAGRTGPHTNYLASDGGPGADTFMAVPAPGGAWSLIDAVQAAQAARRAIRRLDGQLPGQPLRGHLDLRGGTHLVADALDHAAFAIADRVVVAAVPADDDAAGVARLVAQLATPTPSSPAVPFVTIALGDEPLTGARHGHRRGWRDRCGPWLGVALGRERVTVSTSHFAIDGFGHAWLTTLLADELRPTGLGQPPALGPPAAHVALAVAARVLTVTPPTPARLVHRLGLALRAVVAPAAGRSPTIQVPVAPGDRADPLRLRRRVVPALVSVHCPAGVAEPEAALAARLRAAIAREAAGAGLLSRLLATADAMPVPLGWKRRLAGAPVRPTIAAPLTELLAGRGCVSVLRLPAELGARPLIAVSSPARWPDASDPIGSCVVTLVTSGPHAVLTVSGVGHWGTAAACAALADALVT